MDDRDRFYRTYAFVKLTNEKKSFSMNVKKKSFTTNQGFSTILPFLFFISISCLARHPRNAPNFKNLSTHQTENPNSFTDPVTSKLCSCQHKQVMPLSTNTTTLMTSCHPHNIYLTNTSHFYLLH